MKLINSDCIQAMKEMPDKSVDSIVTDPPYELGFMGKSWDNSGIAFNVEVWQEALRVIKPGGHLIAFSGSRTYHRMAVAIEDAGFEIRDQIMWVYGSGFPKSHNLKDDWQGWGTALKPAHEPMVLARKPLIGTVANNVLTYGTGGLNIDASRIEGEVLSVPMAEWTRSGTTGSSDKRNGEMSQPHFSGRWPANFIHDGSDEVVGLFPQTTSGKPSGKRGVSNHNVAYADVAVGSDLTGYGDSGSAARFFYCAKASKRDRNEGLDGFEEIQLTGGGGLTAELREDGSLETASAGGKYGSIKAKKANHHPTVKPTALMQYLVRLVTPPNGTVLDPFMGSGSTGKACAYEGFDFIGIDQSAEYVDIARARIFFAIATNDEKLPL